MSQSPPKLPNNPPEKLDIPTPKAFEKPKVKHPEMSPQAEALKLTNQYEMKHGLSTRDVVKTYILEK